MRKIYLVCPKCKGVEEASKSCWEEVYEEYNRYLYRRDEEGYEEWERTDVIDSEHVATSHKCGFDTGSWKAEDFEVVVENGKIVEVGDYWEMGEEIETVENILKKAGILK